MIKKKDKFKQTEIGIIPEDWEVVKLGNLCEVKSGKRLPKGKSLVGYKTEHQYIRVRDLTNKTVKVNELLFLDDETFKEIARYIITKDDVYISIVGTIGLVGLVPEVISGANLTENCARLTKIKKTTKEWLSHFLNTKIGQDQIRSLTVGTTQGKLALFRIKDINIPLPPLSEQSAIAKILSDLDSKIELNQQMNKTLESIGQAIFRHWFVDFEFPNEKGKPYKSSGGEMVDSELGKIPKGWRVGKIYDLCSSITSGGTPARMEGSFWGGKIAWFKTGELTDGPLLDSEEHISEEGLKNSACKLWDINTVLIALYASPTVGRLGLLKTKATSNQACSGLVAKKEIGYPFLFLNLFFKRDELNSFAVGAAQQNINQNVLKETKIIIPKNDILFEFNEILEDIFNKITFLVCQNRNLSQIRDSLLPKLMSGKIRVPVEAKTYR